MPGEIVVTVLLGWRAMTTSDRYRRLAAECLRIAQQTSNLTDKMLLLEMAAMWEKLAERAAAPRAG
jgi:hypothetical protein